MSPYSPYSCTCCLDPNSTFRHILNPIRKDAPDSEFDLEDKIVPEPSRDQGEDMIQLDDLSELSDIYEPVQSNDNEPNIVEIDDNSEELDFLDLWIQLDYFHFLLFNIFSLSLCQLVIRLKVNGSSGAKPSENFRTS